MANSKLVALIPAHNEAEYIAPVIKSVQECVKAGLIADYRIIENGSTDNTRAVAEMNGAKGKVISIKEKSKGFAIIVGARWAAKRKVESILTLDADLRSFRPEVVRELVQDFEKNKHDMVYALTNEPLPNGEYMCDFAHSGQRIIRLSAIKELIKPGSNFEHLLKRKGITFETLITRLIKNQAPHFGEGYIDYRITPFYAKRAAMHGDVVKKKEQFHNINLMLRYLRRYKQPIEQGVLAKKRLVRKIKR